MNTQRLQQLFERYLEGSSSTEETNELMLLLTDPRLEEEVKTLIEKHWDDWPASRQHQPAGEQLFDQIREAIDVSKPVKKGRLAMLPRWSRIAAAVAIILLLGTIGYLIVSNNRQQEVAVASKETPREVFAPKSTRATLTIEDGPSIDIDSVQNGLLVSEGSLSVVKSADGELKYEGEASRIAFHVLNNPRGSRPVSLTLADGTRVWLNAESSVRFPSAFNGPERVVEINGEVFFEVAHDATKRFVAVVKGIRTEVYGTSFNVNAFPEQSAVRISLLEGSVKVQSAAGSRTLVPGQQAEVGTEKILVHERVNMEQVMAWKNGYFSFENAGLSVVMSEIARWYDLDLHLEDPKAAIRFTGEIDRELTMNQVLSILSDTRIRYRIDGKRLFILK